MALLRLSLGHAPSHKLEDLISAVADGWRKLIRHRRWAALRQSGSIDGFVRALEATWSESGGWNVHLHVLVFTPDVSELATAFSGRKNTDGIRSIWARQAKAAGFWALPEQQHIEVADASNLNTLAQYITKGASSSWNIATELTLSSVKHGKSRHDGDRSYAPFDLLQEFADTGNVDFLERWHEWERATFGRQQLTWGRGTRELLGLKNEVPSDDEIAAQADDGVDTVEDSPVDQETALDSDQDSDQAIVESLDQGTYEVAGLPYESWRAFSRSGHLGSMPFEDAVRLLEAVEVGHATMIPDQLAVVATRLGLVVGDDLLIGPVWADHTERVKYEFDYL